MAKNTIKLKKYSDIIEQYYAVAALTPGHLLELTSAGKVQKHSTAGGNVFPMVALEDELQGRLITTAFSADELVQCWIGTRGEVAYMLLKDGENVAIGDLLESAGDGTLQKHVPDSTGDYIAHPIVGRVVEAVDMSDSSGADPSGRIKVEFL